MIPGRGWVDRLVGALLGGSALLVAGALGVLLAFGASPNPPIYVPIVMSIIFTGLMSPFLISWSTNWL